MITCITYQTQYSKMYREILVHCVDQVDERKLLNNDELLKLHDYKFVNYEYITIIICLIIMSIDLLCILNANIHIFFIMLITLHEA